MGTERIHDPARELEPGASVLVVRPSNRPPALQLASVDRYERPVLALDLPLGEDFDPAEEILLILHSAGVRFAGAARFVSRTGGVATLHLDGRWRRVDARSDLRFPCAHPAELVLENPDESLPATITDISPLGVGVALPECPLASAVRLGVEHDGRHATLDGRVVSQRRVDGRVALSLVFENLNAAQRGFVDEIYGHYREIFLSALPLSA